MRSRLNVFAARCDAPRVNAPRIARSIALATLATVAVSASGCSAVQRRSNLPVTVTLDDVTFRTMTEAGDKVSAGEAPHADGHNDMHLTAHVQGNITALILTICDDLGNHTGTQWDTIVGQDPIPDGFLNHLGAETWVLGVVGADGHMLNRDDGLLPETAFSAGSTIQLFASMREAVQPGRFVCLTALRSDGAPVTARTELRGASEATVN